MIQAFIDTVISVFRRPSVIQVAALCVRDEGDEVMVLLIRSLETGRWIIPKGWPMRGKTLAEAAAIEAWEEAGVTGRISPVASGMYPYAKRLRGGLQQPCQVEVYRMDVVAMADDFPEAGQRQLEWYPAEQAAKKVREPALRALIRELTTTPPETSL